MNSDEVNRAVSKMDKRTIETSISAIRKRLDKHYQGFAEASVSHHGCNGSRVSCYAIDANAEL
jgi:hypothetical protein